MKGEQEEEEQEEEKGEERGGGGRRRGREEGIGGGGKFPGGVGKCFHISGNRRPSLTLETLVF